MPNRIALILLAAVAVFVAAPVAGGSNAAFPGIPSIYVTYNDDCTFSMTADGGFTFTSSTPPGPTLPPGVYQILVLMGNPPQGYPCTTPVFTLSGPGVDSITTFPQQATLDNHVLPALQPSSTYMAYDQNAPAATRVYFTTSATGSSSSLLPASQTQQAGKGSSQADIVGSGITPVVGTLHAAISPVGLATLSLGGRKVETLKAGRYSLRVADLSRHSGLVLRKSGRQAETITTRAFKGTKTVKLTLTSGSWSIYAVPAPAKSSPASFKVAG